MIESGIEKSIEKDIERDIDAYFGGTPTLSDLQAAAKGWYDTKDPTTLKTDLVASFDSANSEYLSITDAGAAGLSGGIMTLSAWVKVPDDASNRGIASAYGFDGERSWMLRKTNLGTIDFRASLDGSASSSVAYAANPESWQLVTVIHDGTTLYLWLDGALVDSISLVGSIHASDYELRIGSGGTYGGGSYYTGDVAHVAYWSRALSTDEITALFNSGSPRNYASLTTEEKIGLVSYWNLNEPRGVAYDSHSQNHLTDNNSVGAAHGPVEYDATQYAGVTKWENQGTASGAFPTLPAYREAPAFIGGAVFWDGLAEGFRATTGTLEAPATVYIIAKYDEINVGAARNLIDGKGFGSSRFVVEKRTNEAFAMYASTYLGATLSDLDRHEFLALFNGVSSVFSIDGADEAGNSGTNDLLGLVVGARYNGWQQVHNGTIEAVLLFDRALTPAEKTALTDYFAE